MEIWSRNSFQDSDVLAIKIYMIYIIHMQARTNTDRGRGKQTITKQWVHKQNKLNSYKKKRTRKKEKWNLGIKVERERKWIACETLLDIILLKSLVSCDVHPSNALIVMIMTSALIATASDLSTPVKELSKKSRDIIDIAR